MTQFAFNSRNHSKKEPGKEKGPPFSFKKEAWLSYALLTDLNNFSLFQRLKIKHLIWKALHEINQALTRHCQWAVVRIGIKDAKSSLLIPRNWRTYTKSFRKLNKACNAQVLSKNRKLIVWGCQWMESHKCPIYS